MEIKKAELSRKYNEMTVRELIKELNLNSPSSLYWLLDKAKIPRKGGDKKPRVGHCIQVVE